MLRIFRWKTLPLLLLLFLADSTSSTASDANSATGSSSSQSCDASNSSATCPDPEQLESNTKPVCSIDMKDEDEEYCVQQASLGTCSGSSEESEILKKRCPKACRTCWSCENVSDDEKCEDSANRGECKTNPRYMLVYCAKACNICHFKGDLEELVLQRLEETLQQEEMERALQETKYGMEQDFDDDNSRETYDKMVEYMEQIVMVDPKYESVRNDCKLRSENCVYWASVGECEMTPAYMVRECAPACQTCELLDIMQRCPLDPDEPTALQPGDLNKLFENMAKLEEYTPIILSRPNVATEFVDDGPWVVMLDTLLTEIECDRLIELAEIQEYAEAPGTYVGKYSTNTTSMRASCRGECDQDPVTQAITKRVEDITGIPSANFERFQLLRYEIGQSFKLHHDYIDHHQERQPGPRSLTILLYLNTVEEGGGTNFPKLSNMTVLPKRGRALIWPAVLDENPNAKDPRTDHQALPIEKGVKFAATICPHQRNFKEPYARGCG